MSTFKFVTPTTSLTPNELDDELIPISGMCCSINSLFLKQPDCYGGHGKSWCLCYKSEFMCCKSGREEEEYCVLQEGATACVKPRMCCKGARQVFCCDSRFACLDLETLTLLDPNFPCLVNVYGLTCFYNYEFVILCCAKWKDIKVAKGTPVMAKPAPSPAPATSPADVKVEA